MERRQGRHLLNFMALCVADELSAFFPERHARSSQAVRLPYRDRSLPTRPQLCLRLAERTCPLGVEALLLQAVAGTNVREDLVREYDRALYKHHPMRQYSEAYKLRLDKYYLSGNSTPLFRKVNGALSQYAPFAVSFFCPYGSAMAKEPCELYRQKTKSVYL
ncbi:hypothetical protein MRX96_054281 [Rhipicephalus microplus]